MTTAVAYVRISSDVEDQRLGVTRQREDVAELARKFDAELVRVFEDNDVSAFTERGPETAWAQLLEFIRRERPDYCWHTGWTASGAGWATSSGSTTCAAR